MFKTFILLISLISSFYAEVDITPTEVIDYSTVTTTSTSTTSTTLYIPECEYDEKYIAYYREDFGWSYTVESCNSNVFTTDFIDEVYALQLMEQGIVFNGYRQIEPKPEPEPLNVCEHPNLFWFTHIQGIDHITAYDDGVSVQIQFTFILCNGDTYDVTGWDSEMGEWNLLTWAEKNNVEIVFVDN